MDYVSINVWKYQDFRKTPADERELALEQEMMVKGKDIADLRELLAKNKEEFLKIMDREQS